MNEELAAIQSALKKLSEAQKQQESASTKALLGALRGVEAALTEIIGLRESEAEDDDKAEGEATVQALGKIVAALDRLELRGPDIKFEPRIQVPAQPAPQVTMPEINMQPQFSVPPAQVQVMPAPVAKPWKKLHVEFNDVYGGVPRSCTITREE